MLEGYKKVYFLCLDGVPINVYIHMWNIQQSSSIQVIHQSLVDYITLGALQNHRHMYENHQVIAILYIPWATEHHIKKSWYCRTLSKSRNNEKNIIIYIYNVVYHFIRKFTIHTSVKLVHNERFPGANIEINILKTYSVFWHNSYGLKELKDPGSEI